MKTTIMNPKIAIRGRKARNAKSEARRNLKGARKRSARRMTLRRRLKKIALAIPMSIRPVNAVGRRRRKRKRKLSLHRRNQPPQLQQSQACPLLKKFAALLI